MIIYPSIASSNCLEYGTEIKRINAWEAIHLDIEDGNFTPNITFGLKTAKAICFLSKAKIKQVHLMTTDPVQYVDELHEMGVSEVFAHIEAMMDPQVFIERCHKLGIKAGIAIKAGTDLRNVEPYYSSIDKILFLTSAPIKGRTEEFIPYAFDRALLSASEIPKRIGLIADGGLTDEGVRRLDHAGFEGVVLGHLVFSAPDPLRKMQEITNSK